MINPDILPDDHTVPGSDSADAYRSPEGLFLDLQSIYYRPGLEATKAFDVKHALHVIIGTAEHDLRETNPIAYDQSFNDRFNRAVAKRMEFRDGTEERYQLVHNEKGEKVRIPIPLETLPDINDFAFDVYDQLEALDSPILNILEQVKESALLVGNEYSSTLRFCMLIAAQDLPASGE